MHTFYANFLRNGAMLLAALALPASAETLLEQGYRQMYDQQFEQAHESFGRWEAEHPADPLGPVSDAAAYLFGELDRLDVLRSEFFASDSNFLAQHKLQPDPQAKQKFEAALAGETALAGQALAAAPADENALFANVLRMGLHADYVGLVEKRYLTSLGEVKQGRSLAERLIQQGSRNYDVYLAVGIENYLLSIKPAPVRWLLRAGGAQTDKATGIRDLTLTAEKGHYLLPYARMLLAVAALRDQDRGKAGEILGWLAREFPNNRLYREELSRLRKAP
jgi:hypothetical protein